MKDIAINSNEKPFRKFVLLFVGIALVVGVSACGNRANVFESSRTNIHQVPTQNQSTSNRLLDQATVTCKNNANCPSEVAMLALGTQTLAGMCTSFLISPTLAITNSHCVPNEVRLNTQSSSQTMKLIFPATPLFESQSVMVSEVVKYSTIAGSGAAVVGKLPDYALLKLATPVNRQILSLSNEGVPDNFALTLYRVSPTSNTAIEGELQVDQCESMMNSAVQPSYNNDFTSVISFSGCELEHGNSGSPLLDSKGTVRAILQSNVDDDTRAELTRVKEVLSIPKLDFLNIGTNAACMDLPGVQTIANDECKTAIPQIGITSAVVKVYSDRAKDPNTAAKILTDVNKDFARWQGTVSSSYPFQWGLITTQDVDFYPAPKCFNKNRTIQNFYSANVPVWKLLGVYDSRLRLSIKIQADEAPVLFQYSLSAEKLKSTKSVNVAYSSAFESGGWIGVGYCN